MDGLKRKNSGKKKFNDKQQFLSNLISIILILLIIGTIYSYIVENQQNVEEVSISEIAADVVSGNISRISVEGDTLKVTYLDETEKISKKEVETSLSETLGNYGVTMAQLASVKIDIREPNGLGFWLLTLLPIVLPIMFILLFFWMISRQVKGAGMQAFSFGQSKARMIDPKDKNQRVTFDDVAGVKEAKEELREIVDFLKNPKKFLDIGARIPKGVILMGAPGTGKTLLARAVAGEARVPFFIISGSEFVEMFVGVGASRVRDLFRMVKKAAPAIIFVDEIDAVGRVRGTGVGGGNDEREQTLNQILVEMDGFEQNEKVIVMAATNRPDVLDPALLRPGRFDRRVTLDLPDRNDREAILKIHSARKPLGEDINLRIIAERTPGFSGADLNSLMNEGAILAARENRKKVTQYDLIRSIEKVMLGPERKSHVLSTKEKKITAYHEAGHALVSSVLPDADPVHKVSIVARGYAGGYTLKLPLEERRLQSKREFLDDLAVSLGGYVAEQMVFGDLTTGPSNDLQVATAVARDMVTRYGMSEKIGPMALEDSAGHALFGRGIGSNEYSETMSTVIDNEVARLINEAFVRAKDVLTKYRGVLDSIARELVSAETIERDEFEKLLILNGIKPKKIENELLGGVDMTSDDSREGLKV
ncbi:MAG: cell division protein FtsH [Candidatus Yonathbacteria bacterium CG_4_10_14_3_um_filter_47_65]|uniref:ATP-dependent zinc metalloprotease FtsH n=2 Tax=Parcubacteria group TaxID=1794811 RepID=A0A2M8D8E7_9BACT|nr:MAG: cell division protein FtsH [Candidatus Nomurabacteria bacterium CG1_02_47_685]PIP03284.1 MAG: cell division protein FtsH [Candidatus Yonathbacteria bacterium CG23_combo_of_CG06-09_8_20_14_all_46_18]PIQ32089.1 MAG: cell division protein FtsH [Candidatus Yonathbacteria bacterium CG17_big_fil_post_rev_8_21_14_2_50_46_19]PIX56391.1 MAG: cell division protein FtsH [Candidatus Yonathbacteria bacterium CG_4_10_14_3_um_filter_47_65]PIY57364.1 MAG: cell division protein FtsH [Candidatus Yonathba